MKITRFKILNSTNLFLQNLLDNGENIAEHIVVTEFQTSGRGQGKNIWTSDPSKNLLFSIGLDISFLKAENQFFLTQMVSVAMINVLKKYLPEDSLFIKWPNDIYFNDKKIAGILIKNEIKGLMMGTSIVGIGLNVNQISFDKSIPNPISMKMITGNDYDLDELLTAISYQLLAVDSQQSITDSYIRHLYRYHQWALFEHEGSIKEMMIIGFDKYGRLILKEKNDHEVVCNLKEIIFIRN